jgi:hypothetical protein
VAAASSYSASMAGGMAAAVGLGAMSPPRSSASSPAPAAVAMTTSFPMANEHARVVHVRRSPPIVGLG